MHFLDSWTRLPAADLLRLLTPAALLCLAVFVPTRWIARATAAGMALLVLFLGELGPRWPVGVGWAALWGVVAWNARPAPRARARGTPGGTESGVVGLMLGLALLALLLAAVARLDLDAAGSRGASYGVLLLCLGLLHLMLRRDVTRAGVAFAGMGLGLQILEHAARQVQILEPERGSAAILLATALAVAAAARLGRVRLLDAGSSRVSDAHDLHD